MTSTFEAACNLTGTKMNGMFNPNERTQFATYMPMGQFVNQEDIVQVIFSTPIVDPVITVIFKDGSRVNFAVQLDKVEESSC